MKHYHIFIGHDEPCDCNITIVRLFIGESARDKKALQQLEFIANASKSFLQPRDTQTMDFLVNLSAQLYGESGIGYQRLCARNIIDMDIRDLLEVLKNKRAYRAYMSRQNQLDSVSVAHNVQFKYHRL